MLHTWQNHNLAKSNFLPLSASLCSLILWRNTHQDELVVFHIDGHEIHSGPSVFSGNYFSVPLSFQSLTVFDDYFLSSHFSRKSQYFIPYSHSQLMILCNWENWSDQITCTDPVIVICTHRLSLPIEKLTVKPLLTISSAVTTEPSSPCGFQPNLSDLPAFTFACHPCLVSWQSGPLCNKSYPGTPPLRSF